MTAVPVRFIPMLPGDGGILQTLTAMRTEARRWASTPQAQSWTRGLVGSAAGDALGEWSALREWLLTNTHFTPDPATVAGVAVDEVVPTIPQMLANIRQGGHAGDCDDIATLAAGLVRALEQPARFVVLGFGPPGPAARYGHVFTEMQVGPGRWRNFDLTRTPQVPRTTRRMEFPV